MTIKQKQATAIGVAVLLAVVFIMITILRADGDASITPFIPVWFAAILPAIIAAQQRRKEETQKQKRKQKREMMETDRYTMMNRLVDDLDEDELDYLEQRLAETEDDEYGVY